MVRHPICPLLPLKFRAPWVHDSNLQLAALGAHILRSHPLWKSGRNCSGAEVTKQLQIKSEVRWLAGANTFLNELANDNAKFTPMLKSMSCPSNLVARLGMATKQVIT